MEIQKENQIAFSELKNYNDSNSFVCLGLLIPSTFEEITETCKEMTDWLLSEGLITKGFVFNVKHITGNIAGEDGRSDVLVILSDDCSGLHPLKRLQTNGLKWTSDFIVNFARDYGVIVDEYCDEEAMIENENQSEVINDAQYLNNEISKIYDVFIELTGRVEKLEKDNTTLKKALITLLQED